MRRSHTVTIALSVLLWSIIAGSAHAAPVPCTGDRIVKVIDIPAAKQPPNMTIDLGYKFPGCFSEGEWVGHLGNSEKYIKLDQSRLQAILSMAGLKEPPPPPSRWDYPWEALFVELLYSVVIAGVVVWEVALKKLIRR